MARIRTCRGFGLVENILTIGVMAMGILVATPFAGTMIRRAEGVGAVNTIRATLASARLQAVRTGANVVVVISRNPDNSIHLASFRDKADLTSSSGNDGNGTQEAGEPSYPPVDVDTHLHLWQHGGARDDVSAAVAFDGYLINGTLDTGLTRRIIFVPTGGVLAPQNANSGTPQPTSPFGRGIYFADVTGKNFFRITVSSTVATETRVEKYVAGRGYVSGNWSWQ